jgi:hypothetical protein
MWTFDRYQKWMAKQKHWHIPSQADESPDTEPVESIPAGQSPSPAIAAVAPKSVPPSPAPTAPDTPKTPKQPIEIEPVEGGLQEVLRKLK